MAGTDTTVMVVDDEQRLADLFAAWLQADNEVRVAYDGEQALEQFDDAVDLVLLDRRMPGLSGDEVLTEIRDRDASAQVVMVTAVDPDFDIIEMGFDDYLVKPVSKDDLLGLVEKMTSRAAYDENIQQFYAVASKKALLEAEKPASELENNAEYQQLVEQFEQLKAEVDDAVADLSTQEDFASAFRGLSPADPPDEPPADSPFGGGDEDDEGDDSPFGG